jgi:hypothetical protein
MSTGSWASRTAPRRAATPTSTACCGAPCRDPCRRGRDGQRDLRAPVRRPAAARAGGEEAVAPVRVGVRSVGLPPQFAQLSPAALARQDEGEDPTLAVKARADAVEAFVGADPLHSMKSFASGDEDIGPGYGQPEAGQGGETYYRAPRGGVVGTRARGPRSAARPSWSRSPANDWSDESAARTQPSGVATRPLSNRQRSAAAAQGPFQEGPHVRGVVDGQHLGVRPRQQAGDQLSVVDGTAVDQECAEVALPRSEPNGLRDEPAHCPSQERPR